jgi:hypothetical protein
VSVLCFLLFLCFRKATQEIFSELDETKAKPSIFSRSITKSEDETEGGRSQAHPRVGRPTPGPCHQGVRLAGPPPDAALSPIYSPRREKPKWRIAFPRNILQAAIVVVARSRGSLFPAPCRRGESLLEAFSTTMVAPEWCVSSLPWTTGP